MSLYDAVLFLHVAASVTLLSGSVVASPAVHGAIRRATSVGEIRAYLRIGKPLLVLEPASAVALLVTGLYLTETAGFWTQRWVQVSLALWVVNSVIAGAIVKPVLGRLTALAAGSPEGAPDASLDALRRARRWSIFGTVLAANDAATLYLMVIRPDGVAAFVAVVVANALMLFLALRQPAASLR